MRILVTGGAGFIGSHLVDKLVSQKHNVLVIDDLSTGSKKFINPKAKFTKVSINSPKFDSVFKKFKPDVVFHLAAQKCVPISLRQPDMDAKINIMGTINLLEFCRKYKVKQFVFTSTGGALYGDGIKVPTPESSPSVPESPYGCSKLAGETYMQMYAKTHGLNCAILRLSNVYGPRQDPKGEAGVIAIFIENLLNNRICKINGKGKQTRDFVYVGDVVDALLAALRKKASGVYNIGTGKEISINKLFTSIAKQIDSSKDPKHTKAISGDLMRSALNNSRAKRILSWKPLVNLDQGIKKTIQWFEK